MWSAVDTMGLALWLKTQGHVTEVLTHTKGEVGPTMCDNTLVVPDDVTLYCKWLSSRFDEVWVSSTASMRQVQAASNKPLPSLAKFKHLVQEASSVGLPLVQVRTDMRPQYDDAEDELRELGINFVSAHTGFSSFGLRMGLGKELWPFHMRCLPGPWLTRNGHELKHFAVHATYHDVCPTARKYLYDEYTHITGQGPAIVEQGIRESAIVLHTINEANLKYSFFGTTRLKQALLWGAHLALPVEYEMHYNNFMPPELLDLCVVHNNNDCHAIEDRMRDEAYVKHYYNVVRDFMLSLMEIG